MLIVFENLNFLLAFFSMYLSHISKIFLRFVDLKIESFLLEKRNTESRTERKKFST